MNMTVHLTASPVAKVPLEGALGLPDTIEVNFSSEYALPELLIVARNGDKIEKTNRHFAHLPHQMFCLLPRLQLRKVL